MKIIINLYNQLILKKLLVSTNKGYILKFQRPNNFRVFAMKLLVVAI
jgi:hypothetical protein